MLIKGKVSASIFKTEVQFSIHMDFTISGKTDWSIAYWRFKFNDEKLCKRYSRGIIKEVKKITTDMGMVWDATINDFSNIDSGYSYGVDDYTMLDITNGDLNAKIT